MASEEMTEYSAAKLFAALRERGLVSQDQLPQLEAFAAGPALAKRLPIALHVLTGLAAFIAAVCFIAFLDQVKLIPSLINGLQLQTKQPFDITDVQQSGFFLWGLLFVAGAWFLARIPEGNTASIKHSFVTQLALCFMGTGKILLFFGVAQRINLTDDWNIPLAILLVTAATYPIGRAFADRFLSVLALMTAVFFTLQNAHLDPATREIWLNVFFIAQLAAAAFLLSSARTRSGEVPVATALVFALCGEVLLFAAHDVISTWGKPPVNFNPIVVNLSLAVCLVVLIGWIAEGRAQILASEPLIFANSAAIMLAVLSAPAVMLSIILMTFGYARHDKLYLTLGGLLMPAFICLYYYNLDVTFLMKSAILIASGGVLLAGWVYMHFRELDRERT